MKRAERFGALALLGAIAACGDNAAGAASSDAANETTPERAICVLQPIGDSGVHGTLTLLRQGDGIHISGDIEGLAPGLHGFHVHQYGDLSDRKEGKSAGGHFAPRGRQHGRPTDEQRHVGDLGNIQADDQKVAHVAITDKVIAFSGAHSILGRAIVVHEGEDHFTQPSGDAGGRVAVGVIGIAPQ